MTIVRTVTNIGTPLTDPSGVALSAKTIQFSLVDSHGRATSAFDIVSGNRVGGPTSVLTNSSGEFTIALWPNDRGDIETQYLCSVDGLPGEVFVSSVPSGQASLSWLDFKLNGTVLTIPQQLALDIHIGDQFAHGATGGSVGETKVQTLTNKTFIDPILGNASATTITITDLLNSPKLSAAPLYVRGGIYFDTTLNKLRIGGAVGWETITSV